jgi:hypothetical protein
MIVITLIVWGIVFVGFVLVGVVTSVTDQVGPWTVFIGYFVVLGVALRAALGPGAPPSSIRILR